MIHFYNHAKPEKITIIPCGFDPSELWPMKKNSARTALWFKSDEKLILHLGRMVPRKGVDNVIHGFALFTKNIILMPGLLSVEVKLQSLNYLFCLRK